jgi:hypothetical protein
MDDFRFK